jgi:hypothetical protein
MRVVCAQVSLGGAEAFAIFVGHLVHAHTFLGGAIEVGVSNIACLHASLYKLRA